MDKTKDHILQLKASDQLLRFYVPVDTGHNEYFTRENLAREFAELIGSIVKSLD